MKLGILGTGEMAGRVAAAVAKMKNVEVAAAASRNLEDACTFGLKHDIRRVFGKYEGLLQDEEVDLVYIPAPQSYHALYSSDCISKGKPVLVEKSFAVNADQAEALIAKAESEKVFITEAMWSRFTPMARKLKSLISDGRIGKINSISIRCGEDMRTLQRVTDPAFGGGALLEKGVCAIDLIMQLVDLKIADITSEARLSRKGIDFEDNIILSFREGDEEVRCMIYASVIGAAENTATVYGSGGYIVVGDLSEISSIKIYDSKGRLTEDIEAPQYEETAFSFALEACRKAIEEKKLECEELTHREIVLRMKILDLIRRGMGVKYPFE
ncbi:MAG: Gfo/Idh/MocA family protein [Anaerovoracaceae bacterium]